MDLNVPKFNIVFPDTSLVLTQLDLLSPVQYVRILP